MSKHTPGPWTTEIDDTGGKFSGWPYINGPKHLDVTIIHRAGFKQEFWGELSKRETLANAKLIAAAPEMKDLLVRVERHLVGLYRAMAPGGNVDAENRFADQDLAVEEIRALLAKLP